ncbi:MAG: hypothetical protein OSB10_01355 [Planctomycetota bacterium]|nr:hypothetical protein [Planctomycetota bacterium]
MGALPLLLLFAIPQVQDPSLETALALAGDNRSELEAALGRVTESELVGLEFLIRHMPDGDLKALSADYLVEHVQVVYQAWNEAPWSKTVPEQFFFENVLPFASINERRDAFARDFNERFKPLVAKAKTPSEAAAILNSSIFPLVDVHYSTKRPKADQSPYESIDAGMASCTGLSILLIDACRSVGVPARFVGVPSWSDDSGNHSWVEIWDGEWKFTGAAEATGTELDKAWFTGRASKAVADSEKYGIFAVSFVETPQPFPMVWKPNANFVFGVNVTSRYTEKLDPVPNGSARVYLRALQAGTSERCAEALRVTNEAGDVLLAITTKDERFDANDHVHGIFPLGEKLKISAGSGSHSVETEFIVTSGGQLISLEVTPSLDAQSARQLASELWDLHAADWRTKHAAEMEARVLKEGAASMPFWYSVHGEAPAGGRSLYISMHGGGGAPARVNDGQWENQKHLYSIDEGVYVAPRAPTNTWNLWHQAHIDSLFDRLIQNMIVFENVNPDRVYLLGYSAGGDGVYQLAPRMADRFGAAAMMAGHPNDALPDGLRNLPFTLHMGGDDGAYDRNKIAAEWKTKLADLRQSDKAGYDHWVQIYGGKGHWMDREDSAALPWMAERTRNLRPERVVWRQSTRTHKRFYWLAVEAPVAGSKVVVERKGQTITVLEASGLTDLSFRLDDTMLDLDLPVVVMQGQTVLFKGLLSRSKQVVKETLAERGDPAGIWSAEVTVALNR